MTAPTAPVATPVAAIVTDIEGTTTPLEFVHDVLFPYAREHLRAFVRDNAAHPDVRAALAALAGEIGRALTDREACDVLDAFMAEDRKSTALKDLQGRLWAIGYATGALRGMVYDDVPTALAGWDARGLTLAVYSSGSVLAQKLIFGHSNHGDLARHFSGWFDTTTGPKREASSYARIAHALSLPPDQVLFLSDIGEELDAARAAGLQTCQLVRDSRTRVASAHPLAGSFDDVAKRVEAQGTLARPL